MITPVDQETFRLLRESGPRPAAKQAFVWAATELARALRRGLSLSTRKRIVRWLGRRKWRGEHVFCIELLRDYAGRDPVGFHRFLWSNHLAYAQRYEVARTFGISNVHASRRILFAELAACLRARGIDPDRDVRSVFEVGCSLGYLLRFAETEMFRSATILRGLDIDSYAVKTGSAYLRQLGSKVELAAADVTDLDRVMGERTYDVVFCCGALMYLDEPLAARVVEVMIRHAGLVVALAGLAHPRVDNAGLLRSDIRQDDEAFVHNLDAMVRNGGGQVAFRRWEGSKLIDGNSIYIILGEPVGRGSPESKQSSGSNVEARP